MSKLTYLHEQVAVIVNYPRLAAR